ncbi:MAG TPA: T9SS type A sorting domain-containing protein [Flavobacteriales bacterium]|nr:T9SS type A sorting domain-containing protein [Flavobacteriales bacterium]
MKKTLLTSFALLLVLAASAQTYFSQTAGTNTSGSMYNSGFASVRTTAGTFVTVAATNAGGFEVSTFSSTGTLMLTTKLANAVCSIDNVAYASELPDGSILVTGTGVSAASMQVFYVAKINLLTNDVTISTKQNVSFSYTKGPRAIVSGSDIYVSFPQYTTFDLNKFDLNLTPVWSKTCEGDSTAGKNPGNDCELIDDTTIIVIGKCDTTLGWGEYDTTGGCDRMMMFNIPGYTRIYGTTRAADGAVIMAGLNQSYTTFATVAILIKADVNGNIIWAKQLDPAMGGVVRFVDVEELPDGRIMAFGTSLEAYSDTYFDAASTFDANGNFITTTSFGGSENTYSFYDAKVYADGILMSGIATNPATWVAKNALVFTDFDFSNVCEKTSQTTNVTPLSYTTTTILAPSQFKTDEGTLPVTAVYGLLTMGANPTVEPCSIGTLVNEIENTTANVYPNPVLAGSNVTVTMNTAGNYTVNVINATGALVSTGTVTGTTASIDTQNMTTGLYIVNIYANGVRVSSEKIAVK